jgi:glycosyltransferase 2 family protein
MKFDKKFFFNILLYLSIIFLVWFLYRFDYLKVKGLHFNYIYLAVSLLFLWAGFYLSTLSWHYILKKHQIPVSRKLALTSHGMSVFAKYIPGKIWVILGRASKVSAGKFSLKMTSYASLKEQLLYIWLGLLLSAIPLYILRGFDIYSGSVLLLFIFMSFLNFSDKFRIIIIWGVKKLFKKELEIPHISFKDSFFILLYISAYWFAWIIAFYLFSLSVYPETSLYIGFIFPLSVTTGILAIFTPGGIGVREGIMTGFMVLSGIPIEIATTISVISRLWFISGEVFIFLLALTVNKIHPKKLITNS